MNPVISVSQLQQLLDEHRSIVILDARSGKDARDQYLKEHVKSARYIDLEEDLAATPVDAAAGGRHPLPQIKVFADKLSRLGISIDSHVVVYDAANGANAAARCWWMLSAVGIRNVQVLSGGFQAAKNEGLAMVSGEELYNRTDFIPPAEWLLPTVSMPEVEQSLKENEITLIDVRDAYRFNGESEPIDAVAGHIPGAVNIPFSENLDPQGNFLSRNTLKEKYSGMLNGKQERIVVHCGSGVTACHTILAMNSAGFPVPALYVGSWSEWSRNGKQVATEI